MNILVFNANAGQFPIQVRKKYPSAKILCCEYFEGYEPWLQKIGFDTCHCYYYEDGKKVLDFGVLDGMKFDLVLENPPYNDSKGGSNGTAGNTTRYKKFREFGLSVLKPNGKLIMVCPKGIIKDLYASPNQVELIDLMTETDHWGYNTLHFVEKNVAKSYEPVIRGGICAKIFTRKFNEWGFTEYARSVKTHEPVEALLSLPKITTGNIPVYGLSNSALPPVPRFICEKLTNTNYLAYDGYIDPGVCGYVTLDSMIDAERLVTFMRNTKIVRFFIKRMKAKSMEKDFFRFSKKFDLSQICTGREYPREFGLTEAEVDCIEKTT